MADENAWRDTGVLTAIALAILGAIWRFVRALVRREMGDAVFTALAVDKHRRYRELHADAFKAERADDARRLQSVEGAVEDLRAMITDRLGDLVEEQRAMRATFESARTDLTSRLARAFVDTMAKVEKTQDLVRETREEVGELRGALNERRSGRDRRQDE